MRTVPCVFIIESLDRSEERDGSCEGDVLSKMLHLSQCTSEYIFIRTVRELESAIKEFEQTQFRYLHFSCHGNKTGLDLALESLSFEELAEMLRPVLKNRRLFFSSCSVMNDRCATALLAKTGCYSVIGPSRKINFDRAAGFWSAFYHLMLRDEAKSMKHSQLKKTTAMLRKLFDVKVDYYSASKSASSGFKKVLL
jgi:hypothetical protein